MPRTEARAPTAGRRAPDHPPRGNARAASRYGPGHRGDRPGPRSADMLAPRSGDPSSNRQGSRNPRAPPSLTRYNTGEHGTPRIDYAVAAGRSSIAEDTSTGIESRGRRLSAGRAPPRSARSSARSDRRPRRYRCRHRPQHPPLPQTRGLSRRNVGGRAAGPRARARRARGARRRRPTPVPRGSRAARARIPGDRPGRALPGPAEAVRPAVTRLISMSPPGGYAPEREPLPDLQAGPRWAPRATIHQAPSKARERAARLHEDAPARARTSRRITATDRLAARHGRGCSTSPPRHAAGRFLGMAR